MRLMGDGETQLESMTQLLEVSSSDITGCSRFLDFSSYVALRRLVKITQGSCFKRWKVSFWRKISVGTKKHRRSLIIDSHSAFLGNETNNVWKRRDMLEIDVNR